MNDFPDNNKNNNRHTKVYSSNIHTRKQKMNHLEMCLYWYFCIVLTENQIYYPQRKC